MNKRVIINSDDFGLTKGVNRGIIELIEAGILSSTSVMTNMPFYDEIIPYKDRIGVGIHLTLTEGKPVLSPNKVPSLVNERGSFYSYSTIINKTFYKRFSLYELFDEFNAQIQRLIDIGVKPAHIDTHESFFKYPYFLPVIKDVATTNSIKGIRTYHVRKFDYSRLLSPKSTLISLILYFQKLRWIRAGFKVTDRIDSILKFDQKFETAMSKLREIFSDLPDGVLELVIHPAYCNGDIQPLGGYDYEREAELKALLSDEFKSILNKSSVKLISYNNL